MKFLSVGLGSMGKRRIGNLHSLGFREIVGFDLSSERRQETADRLGIEICESMEEGLATDPDAVIISTPPDQHTPYAMIAAEAGKPFFTEASVLDDGLADLEALATRKGVVAAPSCTMKFLPAMVAAQKVLDDGDVGHVQTFSHHFGEYLPRWHPWEDYRNFYVSKKLTGACREIVPFELVWLTGLCGSVDTVSAFRAKVGDFDVDIDDAYHLILKFASGCLGSLQVDVLQRVGYRESRFVCSKGVIAWDFDSRRLLVYREDGSWKEYADTYTQKSVEGFYIDEVAAFIAAVRGEKEWPHSISQDREVLKVLRAAEHSSDTGQHVDLASFAG
jgi:predicted dehydrogenase